MRALLIRWILKLMAGMSLPRVHRLGALLGRGLMAFPNDLRDVARINLQHCFPEWTNAEREQLVLQCLQETSKTALEAGAMWLWPVQRVLPLIRSISGEEVLAAAMAKGKGVIFAAPHLGAWEIVGLYVSAHWPMTSLYRPPRMATLGAMIRQGRERAGATLVPTDASGIRSLYKALSRGEVIGILPDQSPERNAGVFAPFFGVQANTMTLLSRLAKKSGATVLMTYAERLPQGEGYQLHFHQVEPAVASDDAVQAATVLNEAIEDCIRQHPAQYQWGYKRFKRRPLGEERFY